MAISDHLVMHATFGVTSAASSWVLRPSISVRDLPTIAFLYACVAGAYVGVRTYRPSDLRTFVFAGLPIADAQLVGAHLTRRLLEGASTAAALVPIALAWLLPSFGLVGSIEPLMLCVSIGLAWTGAVAATVAAARARLLGRTGLAAIGPLLGVASVWLLPRDAPVDLSLAQVSAVGASALVSAATAWRVLEDVASVAVREREAAHEAWLALRPQASSPPRRIQEPRGFLGSGSRWDADGVVERIVDRALAPDSADTLRLLSGGALGVGRRLTWGVCLMASAAASSMLGRWGSFAAALVLCMALITRLVGPISGRWYRPEERAMRFAEIQAGTLPVDPATALSVMVLRELGVALLLAPSVAVACSLFLEHAFGGGPKGDPSAWTHGLRIAWANLALTPLFPVLRWLSDPIGGLIQDGAGFFRGGGVLSALAQVVAALASFFAIFGLAVLFVVHPDPRVTLAAGLGSTVLPSTIAYATAQAYLRGFLR
ncbi:MAG: hypothetical protein U0230_10360 [Polyangiales bacterium]